MIPSLNTRFLFVLAIALLSSISYGQNCSCISGTKNKKDDTETIGGLTSSKDHYSLLFQKKISRKGSLQTVEYKLLLCVASKVLFADSMLKSQGTIMLTHADSSKTILNNVTYYNNPMNLGLALGFSVVMTETQVKKIEQSSVASLTVIDILTTSFADKKQRQLQKIAGCLLQKN
jgi:hypothetical protein